MNSRGFFGIGIYHVKYGVNVGTLWRSAYQLGAAFIFTIGRRYRLQASDTCKSPRSVPLFAYDTFEDFYAHLPKGCQLVGVEMDGQPLPGFQHPQACAYLLGAEDYGLPKAVLDSCHYSVAIPAVRHECFNVSVAGSLVMYDRLAKPHNCGN